MLYFMIIPASLIMLAILCIFIVIIYIHVTLKSPGDLTTEKVY